MSWLSRWSRRWFLLVALTLLTGMVVAACGEEEEGETAGPDPEARASLSGGASTDLVVYSGRTEGLVKPALDAFSKATGIKVRTLYASTSAIAATILEEGKNSPADVVLMQDAGALGALAQASILATLPDATLQMVDARYRSPQGVWVGVSGRARTVVYNTKTVVPERDLPLSILDFSDPKWKGKLGWAPTNGSFQAFVTAMRVQLGEDAAQRWLEGIKANNAKSYPNNTSIVLAVSSGEIDAGFVNHYYIQEIAKQRGENLNAKNFYYKGGDIGSLVNVAGTGILKTGKHLDAAQKLVDYLLGQESQTYFATQTFEFPLVNGVASPEGVPSLASLEPPQLDLSNLADLRGTLDLMRKVGILE